MPITALPTPPSPADTPADFNTKAFNLLGALPTFVTEANALQTDVNAKQASAATSETNALASKNAASTSETNALASKNAAATSETNAAANATAAAASYDSFDDRYLGPKAAAPTLDNDGQALLVGALYWNTTTALMYVWTGSAWVGAIGPLTVPDSQFRITGSVDATKVAMFEVDGLTAGVTRTYALPDASTTLVGIDVAQTLTNKTFGDNPVFSAGSVNGVPYLNGTKVLTTDAAKLAFDGANLGIGTTTPAAKLHAAISSATPGEALRLENTDATGKQSYIGFKNTGINTPTTKIYGGGTTNDGSGTFKVTVTNPSGTEQSVIESFNTVGNVYTALSLAGLEKVRLTSVGLMVGKTSSNSASVGVEIAVGGGLTSTADGNHAQTLNRNTSDGVLAYFLRQNVIVGDISVTTAATTYNSSSDYRLKNIDGPVVNSGAFIDALRPVRGSWKVDGSPFVGFLAHKFQEVSPSSVTGTKDAVDEDGNPIYQSMQASSPEVMANVIAELQSLRAREAAAERETLALLARVAQLETLH